MKDLKTGIKNINREMLEEATQKKAKTMNLPYVDFSKTKINPDFLKLVQKKDAIESKCIPFFRAVKKIRFGVVDVQNTYLRKLVDNFRIQGFLVNFTLISDASFEDAIKIYDIWNIKEKIKYENKNAEKDLKEYEKEIESIKNISAQEIEKMKGSEFLNFVLVASIKTGASDIHIEAKEKNAILRFRIDGIMQKIIQFTKKDFEKIVMQIKFESKMKLNINNKIQDGRLFFIISNRKVDVRVSVLPSQFGESFVMRILDSGKKVTTFEDLGFDEFLLDKIKKAQFASSGLLLNTGPTGSGKTTTLYSIMQKVSSKENKVISLEDPIEYNLDGIVQVQINEKNSLTFANGLKSILRQDPDVVMIGEIRDLETAKIACQAAMTGHFVLSTLHTNSAIESIFRLLNMGIQPFMLAPSLKIIIAQRLVRRPCPKCSFLGKLKNENQKKFMKKNLTEIKKVINGFDANYDKIRQVKKDGCKTCSHTGYIGRIAIAEIFELTDTIKNMIIDGSPTNIIFDYVRKKQKYLTFIENGVLKVLKGLTTIDEVMKVAF